MTVVHDLPLLCTSTLSWLCIWANPVEANRTKSAPVHGSAKLHKHVQMQASCICRLSRVAVHRRRNSSVSNQARNSTQVLSQISKLLYVNKHDLDRRRKPAAASEASNTPTNQKLRHPPRPCTDMSEQGNNLHALLPHSDLLHRCSCSRKRGNLSLPICIEFCLLASESLPANWPLAKIRCKLPRWLPAFPSVPACSLPAPENKGHAAKM